MRRFRDCGCDPRDDVTYVQDATPSPILCTECDPKVCCWVARFDCFQNECDELPMSALGKVYLRVWCEFEDQCRYVSVNAPDSYASGDGGSNPIVLSNNAPHFDNWIDWGWAGQPAENGLVCSLTPYDRCTWIERLFGYRGQFATESRLASIEQLWILDLSDISAVTLTYNGVTYTADAEWVCDGPNTMTMADGGKVCPTLPLKVCVNPKISELDPHGTVNLCDDLTATVEHGCCDGNLPCGYSDADRLACCDTCCAIPLSFTLVCGEETATISGTSSESDVEGTCSPAGRSIMLEGSVTFGGTSYDIKFVLYCDGAQWLCDVYCDGVLDQSCLVAETTCCPFTGTVTIPELSCMVCGVETDCCPDDPVPTTLTMEITGCTTATATLTHNGSNWEGTDTNGDSWSLVCFGTSWILGGDFGCSFSTNPTSVCNPLELVFTFAYPVCPAPHCDGFTATITA